MDHSIAVRRLRQFWRAMTAVRAQAKAQHAALAADLRDSRARADALEKDKREVSARLREKENERHHLLQKVWYVGWGAVGHRSVAKLVVRARLACDSLG